MTMTAGVAAGALEIVPLSRAVGERTTEPATASAPARGTRDGVLGTTILRAETRASWSSHFLQP
jgi:hypothetical protein